MKKTTPKKSLSNRLAQYSALTVAIAGVAEANGQIVYTDITDHMGNSANPEYMLDLNNDGTPDFKVHQYNYVSSYYGSWSFNALFLQPLNAGNEVLIDESNPGNYAYPFALDSGAIISSGQTTWNDNSFSTGYMSLNYDGDDGNFIGVTDKFVGLRFVVSGETYYGWARLDVNSSATSWVVKDYAYNSTPDAPINAGQTLSVGDNQMPNVKVVALNKSIGLYNLGGNTEYSLISVSGQSVLNGSTSNTSHVIEANTIATGVYVLQLKDVDTNAILRKKVIL